ncbi:unnamed protein product [Phytomonas sp. EM1]|nr:unnamed protein product [Phytomonas sp. EM1]|eukprot:CCW60386.1 unnamed protein product [Phytomonas sp. isolate EM1]
MTYSIDDLSESLIRSYEHLSSVLHLPFIERELYETLFVSELRRRICGSERTKYCDSNDAAEEGQIDVNVLLGALKIIVVALREHYRRTVAALKHISSREKLISQVIDLCEQYESGKCALDQAQVSFLLILQEHQNATLLVVEAIAEWRRQLSRPFPFCVFNSTVSYLQRILEDCEAISWCPLGRSLRIHLDTFPCGSNMNFPRMLRSRRVIWRSRIISTGSVFQEGVMGLMPENLDVPTAPYRPFSRPSLSLKPQCHAFQGEGPNAAQNQRRPVAIQTVSSEVSLKERNSRLLVAEDLLLKEAAVQQHLVKELYDLADAANQDSCCKSGKFLLTLSLPGLFLPVEPLEGFYVASAFPLDEGQWKDTLLQVLDQKRCVRMATQGFRMLKRQGSCLLNELKQSETTVNASTPHDSKTPCISCCTPSDLGSNYRIDKESSSLPSSTMASCARRNSGRVKPLSEELLRQTLAPQTGAQTLEPIRCKGTDANGTLSSPSIDSED